jgi:hypothetical protein
MEGRLSARRIIFELIAGEMQYVKDLDSINVVSAAPIASADRALTGAPQMYIQPLQTADPPIVPPQRLQAFVTDVFHNVGQLVYHHRRLLEALHAIQQDEHPRIKTITAAVLDAFLNFRDAYLEYIPNYPIAAYRIEDEKATNPRFREFHDVRMPFPCACVPLTARAASRAPPGREPAGHEGVREPADPAPAAVPAAHGERAEGDAGRARGPAHDPAAARGHQGARQGDRARRRGRGAEGRALAVQLEPRV